jgi:hypothetical protein
MSRLYPFADDSMMGREAGTAGNVKGTDYLAAEVRRLGLVPAGENGTFFQTLPLKVRQTDPASRIAAGGATLTVTEDFVPAGLSSVSATDVPVVWGGTLGEPSALPDSAARGKVVVVRGTVPVIARALQGGGVPYPGAAALVVIGLDQVIPYLQAPVTFLDRGQARAMGTPLLIAREAAAARLFPGALAQLAPGAAGHAATLAVKVDVVPAPHPARNVIAVLPGSDPALKGQYVAIGAHNDHVGIARQAVDHDSVRILNHLVRPGGAEDEGRQATPEQQRQVNAELAAWRAKHPGTARQDSIFNGADDDGSGSVTVLEIAEHLASLKGAARPKRSVLFVWHVAEEKGLWGAEFFTDNPTVPRDSIVAQLNMDMVGRGNAWDVTGLTSTGTPLRGNPDYVQLVGSRRLSTELGDLIETVNTRGKHGLKFDYAMDANGHPMNIYCRSDHYEYARYGIPVVFLTTGGHSDYHQVTDEPQYIDYPHMARVGRLVSDVAQAVANRGPRIALDKPKPDPKGTCQQ